MSNASFTLIDAFALRDLQVFLGRADRVEGASVRLISGGGVLAVYVAVLTPAGLLDESPTVLGLRTFAVIDTADFDEVVPVRSLVERLKRLDAAVIDEAEPVLAGLPFGVNTVTWTSISPPRGGWVNLSPTSSALLGRVSAAGIAEVAEALPENAGEQIVHRVRAEVWGRPIDGLEHVPAGAAFAAFSLGFLGAEGAVAEDGDVAVLETGPWTRLTTSRGHVLVKRRAWSLAR
jgi:hypothetical protein